MKNELYSQRKVLSLGEVLDLFGGTERLVTIDNMPSRRFAGSRGYDDPVSLRRKYSNYIGNFCGYVLDKISDARETHLQRFGPVSRVISDDFERVRIEPDGYMIVNFTHEEDKKGIWNVFYNKGYRVYPQIYNPNGPVMVYADRNIILKSEISQVAPDATFDNDVAEINLQNNPHKTIEALESYFESKKRVLVR